MTTEPPKSEKKMPENSWMIRPCFVYDEEYSECTSMKGRFHQYYVHGESLDCSAWKKDYKNCKLWRNDEDESAFNELIASEQKRRKERLGPHYANTVWKKRQSPPDDWNAPIPKWMAEQHATSYLGRKADELRDGRDPIVERKLCTIM